MTERIQLWTSTYFQKINFSLLPWTLDTVQERKTRIAHSYNPDDAETVYTCITKPSSQLVMVRMRKCSLSLSLIRQRLVESYCGYYANVWSLAFCCLTSLTTTSLESRLYPTNFRQLCCSVSSGSRWRCNDVRRFYLRVIAQTLLSIRTTWSGSGFKMKLWAKAHSTVSAKRTDQE